MAGDARYTDTRADEAERLHALAQTRALTSAESHELMWHEQIPTLDVPTPPSVRWAALRKLFKARGVALHWQQRAVERACGPGGHSRAADVAAWGAIG